MGDIGRDMIIVRHELVQVKFMSRPVKRAFHQLIVKHAEWALRGDGFIYLFF